MKFVIEQVALCPRDPEVAIELLTAMGLGEWSRDHVVANGVVFREMARNEADLAFNYQGLEKARELEILHYTNGENWLGTDTGVYNPRASHLGMHCADRELDQWRAFFAQRFICVAQEVETESHTNPVIAGKRTYRYVIFNTYPILGIDVKFIVRKDV